ncbi:MAG: hypothetical protein RML46_07785 [Anaerolineae bacterium]|nr:hypothetical protein [Anaerolineae bacterium]MDW8068797.1 hypothetical protein [Anaerolineae bacterium]
MTRVRFLHLGGIVTAMAGVLLLMTLQANCPTDAVAAQPAWVDPFRFRPAVSANLITCTLAVTTTDAIPYNQSFSTAAILADYTGLALVQGVPGEAKNPSEDYFRLDNAVPGWTYEVSAVPDGVGNYNLGLIVYDAAQTPILTDTNTLDGNSARVRLVAGGTGPYYFKVLQISNYCSGGTYHLEASASAPTATPTPTPTPTGTATSPPPTGIPGADRFEPNYDFDRAATIATGVTYDNLNFIPWGGATEDNDFYKLWVKPGLLYTCETLNLAPGLDTNIIYYDRNRNGLGGNDDVTPGDYRSRITYLSPYEGWLYILVGHGGRFPYAEVQNSTYSLRCTVEVPGLPTPAPTATPRPPTATPVNKDWTPTPEPFISPPPTPTSSQGVELSVRLIATPPPPSPEATPAPRFVPLDILVYYDANNDRSPGAGEGVAGLRILAYDTLTGEQVAEGTTDEQGHLRFTAAVRGAVRIFVPYLGIGRVIGGEGASVYIRIAAPTGSP